MKAEAAPWHLVSNINEIDSPALLVYPDRVEENIGRIIAMAGGVGRLRPHIKTHKMPEIVRMHLARGITKFKCATIAEAEMAAASGAPDVLLAIQPVGPNGARLLALARKFPRTIFSAIADDGDCIRTLSRIFADGGAPLELLLDIDCGMHRSGVEPGPPSARLYSLISSLPGLKPGGLHAYDGHIHDSDRALREKNCEAAFAPVHALRKELAGAGLLVPKLVAGGTPTFPILARRPEIECSPGTCVLWDFGYGTKLPDLDFLPAALLLTRVISKPGADLLCLDLGHKAVAAENPHPRVQLLGLPEAKFIMHSEEHLLVKTERAADFSVGDCLYGVPWHICPTVALHSEAVVINHGHAGARWKIAARERRLTI